MARFFNNSNTVSAFIVDSVSAAINRRGYATASQGVVKGRVVRNNVLTKNDVEESNKTASWVPDPITGYYRPETRANKEIDAAELRNMLLKHKPSQH